MSQFAAAMQAPTGDHPMAGAQPMAGAPSTGQQQQQPPAVDMNTLAAFVQQYNQQRAPLQSNGADTVGIHEALAAALSKGLGGGGGGAPSSSSSAGSEAGAAFAAGVGATTSRPTISVLS